MTQVKVTIDSFVKNILVTQSDMTNQQILDEVKKVFPNAKTSLNSIAWYKSDIKKNPVKTIVKERTLETIQEELESYKKKVQELEEEVKMKQEEEQEKNMKEFERLCKLLNKEVV